VADVQQLWVNCGRSDGEEAIWGEPDARQVSFCWSSSWFYSWAHPNIFSFARTTRTGITWLARFSIQLVAWSIIRIQIEAMAPNQMMRGDQEWSGETRWVVRVLGSARREGWWPELVRKFSEANIFYLEDKVEKWCQWSKREFQARQEGDKPLVLWWPPWRIKAFLTNLDETELPWGWMGSEEDELMR
jgi:hypothetical protein